jgi:hypothetical protein
LPHPVWASKYAGGFSDQIGAGMALFRERPNERRGVQIPTANQAPTAVATGIVAGRRKWFVLISVSIGTFMVTLDGSIVNIALPKI